MEERKHSSKIICLFSPPLINNFDFQSGTEIKFFSPQNGLKIDRFLSEAAEKKCDKLVLINYPSNEKQVDELSSVLAQMGLKITDILLCNLVNYDLMSEVRNKYLICPHCKKIFDRETTVKENEEFVCPWDSKKATLSKVNKFNENHLTNYFQNSKKIVETLLSENKQNPAVVHQLDISQEKEISSGELREKILKLIDKL